MAPRLVQGWQRHDEQTGTTSVTTSTITGPETTAGSLAPQGSPLLMSAPGWGPRRPVLPGTDNPDPAPETTAGTRTTAAAAGGASASSGQDTASIRELFKGRAKSYAVIAATLLKAAGGMLNTSAAAAAGADTDAWLPDDDDLDTIPPPIGRIAARRIKIGANPEQLSDLEDIGMAAVGLLMWAAKGVTASLEARRYRRRLEADKALHADAGDGR